MKSKSPFQLFLSAFAILIFSGCASLIGMSMRQPEPIPPVRIDNPKKFVVLNRSGFKDSKRFLDSAITIRKFPVVDFENDSMGIPDFKSGMPVDLADFPISDSIDFYVFPYNFEAKLATFPSGVFGYGTWNAYRSKIVVISRDSAAVVGTFEVKGFSRNWQMTFSKKGYLYSEYGDSSILPDYDIARMAAAKDFIVKIDAIVQK